MATLWGRKETIIWPPHKPIYSFGAIFFAVMLTCFFAWERFAFSTSPLQRYYTEDYLRAEIGAVSQQHGKYELLYVGGGKNRSRLAVDGDVIPGRTPVSPKRVIGLTISPAAKTEGYLALYPGPQISYSDLSLAEWMRRAVFDGRSLPNFYSISAIEGLVTLALMLYFAIPQDIKRLRQLKYGRRLKGPVMHTPKEFIKHVRGDGIGFKTTESKQMIRIPQRAEAQHMLLMGDTGAGKTALILQVLRQIQSRGDSAIVYDPAREFTKRFYDPRRGDIILNPLDDRCPYWGPSEELRKKAEAKSLAASLYQPTTDKKGEFFIETPQKIFSHLLTFGPTPKELVAWLSDPAEVDRRVAGTEMATMIAKGAQQQRNGVLASLGLIADSLRFLPTKEQADGRTWSATEWSEERKGWIFLTSQEAELEALLPLQSLWIDLLVLRLMNAPKGHQRRVWFILDELATLQRLPQLHAALTKGRKSHNPILLGIQGKTQVEVPYSRLAETMLSQPATKIFLRTSYPASEWISRTIGKIEIERLKETRFTGMRSHRNFSLDRQEEPLVMDSEIQGLDDRHAFLKLNNNIVRFEFDYMDVPQISPEFIPRKVDDDELSFDPKTLKPKKPKPQKKTIIDLEAEEPEPVKQGVISFEE